MGKILVATLAALTVGCMTNAPLAKTTPAKKAAPSRSAKAPLARPVFGSEPLSAADLVRYALWRDSWKPKDQFEATPTEGDMDRKAFVLNMPLKNGPSEGAVGTWAYDPAKQEVEIAVHPSIWSTAFQDVIPSANSFLVQGYYLAFTSRKLPSYVATNGFGAKVNVESYSDGGVAIIYSVDIQDYATPKIETIQMSPEQARTELPGARVIILGSLVANDSKMVVGCVDHHIAATFDGPTEINTHVCGFNSSISSIEVVSATGKTLASFGGDQSSKKRTASTSNASLTPSPNPSVVYVGK